ncbi:MAG: TonB-dependent receptor [Opitutaceae bacterium]
MAAAGWMSHVYGAGDATSPRLKEMSLEELMEVEVVSVSGYTESLNDAPSAIQVIRGTQLVRSGAATIAEGMRLAHNLNVAQKNPHDWAISARGFNANVGNKLLVLMDGRSVYTPLFAGVFWNAQDYLLEDIAQIEAISGPGGTLWGANAMNGVINIITKSARETQGSYVQAGLGSELRGTLAARYGGKLAPDVYFRVYGKFLNADEGELTGGRTAANGWEQAQGGFRVDVIASPTDTLTLQGDIYAGDLDLQSGETARLGGGNLLARWSRETRDVSESSLQVYFDRTHIAVPFAASPFAPAGFLKDRLDTFDVKAQHSTRLGNHHRVTGGGGYRHTIDRVKQQAPNLAFLPADLEQGLANIFLQDEITLSQRMTLTLGSKFEHNEYTGFEYEPNVRAQWKLQRNQLVWMAASRAVRMPSRYDRDLYQPAPPLSLLAGGPRFVSETVKAYELGYRAQVTSRISGSLSLFFNDYDDLRSWGVTPVTTFPIVFENNLEARSHGLELAGETHLADWWRLNAGFVLLRESVRVKPGKFDLQNALDETADPRHQASLTSSMDLRDRLQFDASVRWVDSLRNNNNGVPGTVPSYTELALRVCWQFSRQVDLAVVGQNLLHAHHPEYGPPGPNREELQRSVSARITWRK